MAADRKRHSQEDAFALPGKRRRYYFDSRDGDRFINDDVGLEFETIEAARDEATRALAELAKDVLPRSERRELSIEIRDENKAPLLTTRLVFEAVRLQ